MVKVNPLIGYRFQTFNECNAVQWLLSGGEFSSLRRSCFRNRADRPRERFLPVTLSDVQRAYLDEIHYAVVSTLNADGSIQQTVVWYLLDDKEICFSCGASSVKARNLRRNPTVSIAIANGRRYLTLQGTAVVEPPDPTVRERLAIRYLGADGAAAWLQLRPDAPRLTVRVTVTKVYGQGV